MKVNQVELNLEPLPNDEEANHYAYLRDSLGGDDQIQHKHRKYYRDIRTKHIEVPTAPEPFIREDLRSETSEYQNEVDHVIWRKWRHNVNDFSERYQKGEFKKEDFDFESFRDKLVNYNYHQDPEKYIQSHGGLYLNEQHPA